MLWAVSIQGILHHQILHVKTDYSSLKGKQVFYTSSFRCLIINESYFWIIFQGDIICYHSIVLQNVSEIMKIKKVFQTKHAI